MNYLNFDKSVLTNLEKSLTKEMLRTNRSGAYNSSTIIDCNTRKYHGQLVVPIPEIDNDNHVLLSSLDETVIQHGVEFCMSVHQYAGGQFSPNGHKYIREFSCETISKTIYRMGGVIIAKEKMMVSNESRIITKYTILEAQNPITMQFKPFLAFRSVHKLSKANPVANNGYREAKNGICCNLYEGYPDLYMQFSMQCEYSHNPYWYENLEYYKELERGYDGLEDLLVPGTLSVEVKKGDSLYFTAGTSEITPSKLKAIWEAELKTRVPRTDMFNCLVNAAEQFDKKTEDGTYLLAGYPWFHTRARDEFASLPGICLPTGRTSLMVNILDTAHEEIKAFMKDGSIGEIEGLEQPDALLWFIWAVQQLANAGEQATVDCKYGNTIDAIIKYYTSQNHPTTYIHSNSLLWADGTQKPMTWMNATEDGRPITPRTGYIVEVNALWYNAIMYAAETAARSGEEDIKDRYEKLAETVQHNFIDIFWNGFYLYDYVNGFYKDVEVRPNMVLAIGLPYSPLDKYQQKSVLDICTRELLTTKGLRSLSPKSGFYRPNYVGGMKERNRNYHNGPVWPWLTSFYADAYLRIHKRSGYSFMERIMIGMEAEMKKLCVSTLSELFDGNPPYKGHGASSYAGTVASTLRTLDLLKQNKDE